MRVTGINKRIVLLPNATWYILSQARKGKDPRWATLDYETYPQQYSWLATLLLQMIREGHVEVYAKFTESPFYEKSDLTGRTYYIDFENSSYVRFSSDLDDILNDEDQIRDLDELALPLASVKKLARQFRNGEIADHPVYDSNGFASIVSGEFLKSTPKHV